ncbi:hypothetical protein DPEC_G00094050 [Dallia pectoralis]|uniref:Uncharacterized protein n=1 Tax=Dallia pectoralis TaxID=75939 RepID=A0ACC2H1H6_DALPE|nr:hypothetical protein DPEC_G00094050 [Dallia pectoralis]
MTLLPPQRTHFLDCCSTLCVFLVLLLDVHGEDASSHQTGGVGSQCGEYSNQVMENGMCQLVATLPNTSGQRCPDMFRCTDEVSYWLHENEERKEQILSLRETISELQEDLRNHRHRIKVLELQAQIHNLSRLVESVRRSPGCMINIVRTSSQMSAEEALHPDVRNCPIDCASIYYNGVRHSGLYTVVPSLGAIPVEVYCDMETEGGGWTVLQRRVDGSVTFDRSWREYKEGFGDLHSEFWLGNTHIHDLTSQGDYSLRIDMEDWSNKHKHAFYESFSVDGEDSQYRLHVSGFSGTTEDSFSWYHDMQSFSTPDTGNICAEISHAGWWYNQCFYANLNGIYYTGGRYSPKEKNPLGPDGIVWYSWKDSDYYSLRKVCMMIRPRTFRPHMSP